MSVLFIGSWLNRQIAIDKSICVTVTQGRSRNNAHWLAPLLAQALKYWKGAVLSARLDIHKYRIDGKFSANGAGLRACVYRHITTLTIKPRERCHTVLACATRKGEKSHIAFCALHVAKRCSIVRVCNLHPRANSLSSSRTSAPSSIYTYTSRIWVLAASLYSSTSSEFISLCLPHFLFVFQFFFHSLYLIFFHEYNL